MRPCTSRGPLIQEVPQLLRKHTMPAVLYLLRAASVESVATTHMLCDHDPLRFARPHSSRDFAKPCDPQEFAKYPFCRASQSSSNDFTLLYDSILLPFKVSITSDGGPFAQYFESVLVEYLAAVIKSLTFGLSYGTPITSPIVSFARAILVEQLQPETPPFLQQVS